MGNLLPSLGRRKLPLLDMPKAGGSRSSTSYLATFGSGNRTFTAPADGTYTFYAFGAGGGGGTNILSRPAYGGGGAASGKITKKLAKGQSVTLAVGVGGNTGQAGGNTTLTFPDSSVATATGGGAATGSAGGSAGTAMGFDTNQAGTPGNSGAGGDCPGFDSIQGGFGSGTSYGSSPVYGYRPSGPGGGAGGVSESSGNTSNLVLYPRDGGDGAVIVTALL